MIREALEYLVGLGVRAKPDVVKVDCEPPHVYYLRKPDGSLEHLTATLVQRNKATDLETLVRLAVAWHAGECTEIWCGPTAVVAAAERDTTTYELRYSDPYATLGLWKNGKVSQPDLVRALRTTFAGCVADVGFLPAVSKVKFTTGTTVESEVGHGKASLGKSIMGEVTGTGAIPETVVFNVPVYANPDVAYPIPILCAVEADAAEAKFRITPLPGQLELAVEMVRTRMRERLASLLGDKDVPVYNGSPG